MPVQTEPRELWVNGGGKYVMVAGSAKESCRRNGGRPATPAEAKQYEIGKQYLPGREPRHGRRSPMKDLSPDVPVEVLPVDDPPEGETFGAAEGEGLKAVPDPDDEPAPRRRRRKG